MDLTKKVCVACEGGIPPLSQREEDELLKEVSGWVIDRKGEHKIRREFVFTDFNEAMDFVNKVAKIADKEGHHPDIYIFYNKVRLELYTHAIGGLHENDFIVAAKINKLLRK